MRFDVICHRMYEMTMRLDSIWIYGFSEQDNTTFVDESRLVASTIVNTAGRDGHVAQ